MLDMCTVLYLRFRRSLSLSCVVLGLRAFEERYCIDISGITTPFHSLPRIIHVNVDVEALRPEQANDLQAPRGFSSLSICFEVSSWRSAILYVQGGGGVGSMESDSLEW